MNTTEMIKTLATRLKITQKEAGRHFHEMFAVISASLQKGEKVVLRGFGAFGAAPGKPFRTYDPSTKEFVPQPPQMEIFFRPHKPLKDDVSERRLS